MIIDVRTRLEVCMTMETSQHSQIDNAYYERHHDEPTHFNDEGTRAKGSFASPTVALAPKVPKPNPHPRLLHLFVDLHCLIHLASPCEALDQSCVEHLWAASSYVVCRQECPQTGYPSLYDPEEPKLIR